jgi:hypothetical protein
MGSKIGSKLISVVGIEGEKIAVTSKWLDSLSMASLVIPSLSSSQCPTWE